MQALLGFTLSDFFRHSISLKLRALTDSIVSGFAPYVVFNCVVLGL